jgi:hypothetical protein
VDVGTYVATRIAYFVFMPFFYLFFLLVKLILYTLPWSLVPIGAIAVGVYLMLENPRVLMPFFALFGQ